MRSIFLSLALMFAMASAAVAGPYASLTGVDSTSTHDITGILTYHPRSGIWTLDIGESESTFPANEVIVEFHFDGPTVHDKDGNLGFMIGNGEGIVWLIVVDDAIMWVPDEQNG